MAKCEICGKDMLKTNGCVNVPVIHHGKKYNRIKVGDPGDWYAGAPDGRCGDCGAKVGYYHHPDCDCERCPICGEQLFGCDCQDPPSKEGGI